MAQVIIVPYFSEPEIDRYLRIADRLEEYAQQQTDYCFLLAASPRIEPSRRLFHRFSQIAPCVEFQCPTQIFGYPQGPTAMFWDCMEHIEAESPHDGGFSLWLESDMVPVAPDWIDRLTDEWNSHQPTPLLMGCYVPKLMKQRLLRRSRIWLPEHINGGACYSKDFVTAMPEDARDWVFDLAVFAFAEERNRAARTNAIGFATVDRLEQSIANPDRVLLHGFMQDKDAFIERCLSVESSTLPATPDRSQLHVTVDHMVRQLRARFITRGQKAMLDTLLLRQEQLELAGRRAA